LRCFSTQNFVRFLYIFRCIFFAVFCPKILVYFGAVFRLRKKMAFVGTINRYFFYIFATTNLKQNAMNAKRLFFALALVALFVTSCSVTKLTPEEKAARAAAKAEAVTQALQDRNFTIEVDYMTPRYGVSRRVDFGYELTVHGDSVYSCLPYFGRAYRLPYGGGVGLNFVATMQAWRLTQMNNEMQRLEIEVRNEEDTYLYTVDVFSNGRANIDVYSQNRDGIGYTGEMIFK